MTIIYKPVFNIHILRISVDFEKGAGCLVEKQSGLFSGWLVGWDDGLN